MNKTIEDYKVGSGRNSIDYAERDISEFPNFVHDTIPEFPAEDEFKSAQRKRDFNRMLVMS